MFAKDWSEARGRFLDAARRRGMRIETLPLTGIAARGPHGEELVIDTARTEQQTDRCFVYVCGVHGVEGFAGSAIIERLLAGAAWWEPHGLVVVHGANPFGMAWGRRVNESNVDLNRNFLPSTSPENPLYARVRPVAMPTSPPSPTRLALQLGMLVLQHGLAPAKQALVGGQHVDAAGLFYGGTAPEESARVLSSFFRAQLGAESGVKRVVAVDLHTGLGPRGKDTLFVVGKEGEVGRVSSALGRRVSPLGAAGDAYDVAGGLPHALPSWLPHARVDVITQEMGTTASRTALHALIAENHAWQAGERDPQHPARKALRAAFDVDDDAWRTRVLGNGERLWGSLVGLLGA